MNRYFFYFLSLFAVLSIAVFLFKDKPVTSHALTNKHTRWQGEHLLPAGADAEEYERALYRQHGITPKLEGEFPVVLFENDKVPVPENVLFAMAWLDDDTIIYNARPDPLRGASDRPVITVNLKSFERGPRYTVSEFESRFRIYPRFPHASHKPCPETPAVCFKMRDDGIYATYEKVKSSEALDAPADQGNSPLRFNQNVILIKGADGKEKKRLTFDSLVSLPFHYDGFSDLYWIASYMKAWRFDRHFNLVSEEKFPSGVWGGLTCALKGIGGGMQPCMPEILQYSVRHGFVIAHSFPVAADANAKNPQFDIGGLFLAMKDGSLYKIYQGASGPGHLSVSPDGCKVLFVDYSVQAPNGSAGHSEEGQEGAKVGVIDVCKYFKT